MFPILVFSVFRASKKYFLPATLNASAIRIIYIIATIARIISAKQLYNIQTPILNTQKKKELNILSANYIQEILINNKDIKYSLDKFSEDWQKL